MENDGEVESSSNVQASMSDSFLDDFLKSAQTCCTHTHTCNPPGPEFPHSHTCFHTHTHPIPLYKNHGSATGYVSLHDEKNQALKVQRVPGNREAVRKYREKKKAQTVYLEEEVKKLRFLNTQLIKKVQKQATLEREILRLRSLLVTFKGKIDDELSDFPFLKQSSFAANPLANSSVQACEMTSNGCEQIVVAFGGNCQSPRVDCQADRH